jgi:hypothetical protein
VTLDESSVIDNGDSANDTDKGGIKLCVPSTVAHMPQTTIQLLQVSRHLSVLYICTLVCYWCYYTYLAIIVTVLSAQLIRFLIV